MSVDASKLPPEVRAIVGHGWHAVVFKGLQVLGIFPQRELANGYVANLTGDDGVYDRGEFEVVSRGERTDGGHARVKQ